MSAIAQKMAADKRLKTLIDRHAEALCSDTGGDLASLRLLQGTIQGLRMALNENEAAYKQDLGG